MPKYEFRKLFTPEKQKLLAELDEYYEKRLIEYRNMETGNLIATTKYFISQMEMYKKHQDYKPTYDATFFLLILPELIRRLKEKEKLPCDQKPSTC